MYVIVVEVVGFYYYYNEDLNRMEGLIDNATKYDDKDIMIGVLFRLRTSRYELFSYIKIK